MANEFKVKKGLIVDGSNTVLDVQGTSGQLFSVTDSLTGDLFSVSDVSGVPILSVNSSGAVDVDGDINLGYADKINFGTSGSGLEIYADSGSNSYIKEKGGSGALVFQSNHYYFQDNSNNTRVDINAANGNTSFTGNITTSGYVGLNATSTLFFDANTHGHTLIKEISDDRLGVTVGNRLMLDLGENGDSSSYIDMHAPTVSIHSNASSFPLFQIKNTHADAQAPRLALIKDSSSPADNDETGRIYMYGDNDAGEQIETFLARTIFTDVSDGSEDSKFEILTYCS